MTGRRLLMAVCCAFLGCVVPDLEDLEAASPGRCDAQHGCAEGYECVEGVCQPQDGTACIGDTAVTCGRDVGECVAGVRTCSGGVYGACVGAVDPTDEVCNGNDDDCDGDVDEGATGGDACELSQGVCASAARACVSGTFELTCSAASYGPRYEPAETTCDGQDNDCDGTIDRDPSGAELFGGDCELTVGLCAGARRACTGNGFEPVCTGSSYGPDYEPLERTCGDGLDNDCDGRNGISREATLVNGAGEDTSELTWVQVGDEYWSAYSALRGGKQHVFFRRFDRELRPLTPERDISPPYSTASRWPSIAHDGTDAFVAYLDQTPDGDWQILLAKVDGSGLLLFKDGSGNPAVKAFGNSLADAPPRIAVAPLTHYVMIAWIRFGNVMAASFESNGAPIAAPATLYDAADPVKSIDVAPVDSTQFRIAAAVGRDVYELLKSAATLSGTQTRKWSSTAGFPRSVAWSPDGEALVFVVDEPEVCRMMHRLATEATDKASEVYSSAQSIALAAVARDQGTSVVIWSETGTQRLLAKTYPSGDAPIILADNATAPVAAATIDSSGVTVGFTHADTVDDLRATVLCGTP